MLTTAFVASWLAQQTERGKGERARLKGNEARMIGWFTAIKVCLPPKICLLLCARLCCLPYSFYLLDHQELPAALRLLFMVSGFKIVY